MAFTASLLLALAQFRLIYHVLWSRFMLGAAAADGVLSGTPHWRIQQSRVLSPWLVRQLSGGGSNAYVEGTVVFTVFGFLAAGLIVLYGARRVYGSWSAAVASFLILHVGCFLTYSYRWLYSWDITSLVLFSIFILLVLRRAGPIAFSALFVVGVLNRETAAVFGLWMILDPLVNWGWDRWRRREPSPLRWSMVLAGVACLIGGALVVEGLRSELFVRETMGAADLADQVVRLDGIHVTLWANLAEIGTAFTHVSPKLPFLIPLYLLGFLLFTAALVRVDVPRYLALAAVHVALLVAVLLFGLVFEARLFFELIPLVALMAPRLLEPGERARTG